MGPFGMFVVVVVGGAAAAANAIVITVALPRALFYLRCFLFICF